MSHADHASPGSPGSPSTKVPFDATVAQINLDRMWGMKAQLGWERSAAHVYLNDVVSDRYALTHRFQLLRDELQLAGAAKSDLSACAADMSIPSVLTTVAKTNCGDRVHQGEATITYIRLVAARFATLSEIGDLKLEAFSPTGGGTDDGATLAHVTIAHNIDNELRRIIYGGNAQSFVLAGFDLQTHVGRFDDEHTGHIAFGRTQESPFRSARAACGAIVGTLSHYDANNQIHRRIRSDLGEENFKLLSTDGIKSEEGIVITDVVAAAVVALSGMNKTAVAVAQEQDGRGMSHLTASLTINMPAKKDKLMYLGRTTVFNGVIKRQGLGLDASKYAGKMVPWKGGKRLVLTYDGCEDENFPITSTTYEVTGTKVQAHGGMDI